MIVNYRQHLDALIRPMWKRGSYQCLGMSALEREWRLLHCAISEIVMGDDDRIRALVEFGRQMADGKWDEMDRARVAGGLYGSDVPWQRRVALGCCSVHQIVLGSSAVYKVAGKGFHREVVRVLKAFAGCDCDPLSWDVVRWNSGCVRKVAWAVYCGDGELCVLGDALQDAGYGDVRLLDRVYSDEWCGKGAWVLDWVLGYAPVG